MMHPSWSAMVSAGEAVNFFGVIPFSLVSYTGTVIPIIFVVFVQSLVHSCLRWSCSDCTTESHLWELCRCPSSVMTAYSVPAACVQTLRRVLPDSL